jgi:hypothetical protein
MIDMTQNDLDRFWRKVDIRGIDDCWNWLGTNTDGYGLFRVNGKMARCNRIVYEWYVEDIDDNLCVLHKCDNHSCCNPNHLFKGTDQDNMDDMSRKFRSITLSKDLLEKILEEYSRGGISYYTLGKKYGVSSSYLGFMMRNKDKRPDVNRPKID